MTVLVSVIVVLVILTDFPDFPPRHIKFRNCKLTLLLRDVFVSAAQRTVFISCIAPLQRDWKHSRSTLGYTSKLKLVDDVQRGRKVTDEELQEEMIRFCKELPPSLSPPPSPPYFSPTRLSLSPPSPPCFSPTRRLHSRSPLPALLVSVHILASLCAPTPLQPQLGRVASVCSQTRCLPSCLLAHRYGHRRSLADKQHNKKFATGIEVAKVLRKFAGHEGRLYHKLEQRYRDAPTILLVRNPAKEADDWPGTWSRKRVNDFITSFAPEVADRFNVTGSQMLTMDNKTMQRRCGGRWSCAAFSKRLEEDDDDLEAESLERTRVEAIKAEETGQLIFEAFAQRVRAAKESARGIKLGIDPKKWSPCPAEAIITILTPHLAPGGGPAVIPPGPPQLAVDGDIPVPPPPGP